MGSPMCLSCWDKFKRPELKRDPRAREGRLRVKETCEWCKTGTISGVYMRRGPA